MNNNSATIIIWIIIWLIWWYLIAKIYFQIQIRWQRKNAVSRSKNVLMWQVNEKIAPLLPNFPYNYKDLVFIWKWIDYIVFDWLSTWNLKEIVFLEVKSWVANLNRNERMVKDTIRSWRIAYDIMRVKR